jgi:hypothetical protein
LTIYVNNGKIVTFCKNYGIEFVDFALAESKMKAISIISTLAVNNELTKKGALSSTPLIKYRGISRWLCRGKQHR